MRALRRLLSALGLVSFASAAPLARATPPPLSEVQVISLPGVERRIDHFAVDPAGNRLFVAALGALLDVAQAVLAELCIGGGHPRSRCRAGRHRRPRPIAVNRD
jgi:hypothetical protein